jgi:carbamoyl-phosphate synthase large subunit
MQALAPHLQLVPFADSSNRESLKQLVDRAGFPLVVKARRSSGSQGVRVVHNPGELERWIGEGTENLVQQFIDDGEGEFSVGIFSSRHFTEVFAFRRELRGVGCSWFAETSQDVTVIQYALAFAKASGLLGSANIQLRKNRGQVYLLEVNARFSSLVAARAICGFRDAEWSVQDVLGRPLSTPPIAYGKIKFRRFFHELVDQGAGYFAIAEWMPSQGHASFEAKQR